MANIELRCRARNGYEAKRVLGLRGEPPVREPAAVYVTAYRAQGPVRTSMLTMCSVGAMPLGRTGTITPR